MPQQRRFLLTGADPMTRWLDPYLDARNALFSDVPYHVPGGPDLRAYQATRPLVKRYIAASGTIRRAAGSPAGVWGRLGGYLAAAWTPGIPDRLGPEQLNEAADLLFDWQELPEGEGKASGRFRARSLEVSKLWADAGLVLTGGYRKVAVSLWFPIWASQAAFAGDPILGDQEGAFALRWALTIAFVPQSHPGG